MTERYAELIQLLKNNTEVSLATVVEAKGATPQVVGASALFSSCGRISGTVGGGIVEAEVQKRTLQALKKKRPTLVRFNLSNAMTSEEGAVCGGEMRVLIDPLPGRHVREFYKMKRALSRRKNGILATLIRKGHSSDQCSLSRIWLSERTDLGKLERAIGFKHRDQIKRIYEEMGAAFMKIEEKRPGGAEPEGWLYLEPHFPLPQLLIIGAGHIGQAVAHLGKMIHFEVIVMDDRPEYACRERFPEADRIIVGNIRREIRRFPLASDIYVVIATRGHRHDEEALRECIHSRVGYLGMVGSLHKVRLMRERFTKMRWAKSPEFNRVHAPIGIPICSKTVEEIAMSIAAELILVRRQNQERKSKKGRK
ncbi:MAG: XdhC family protein [Candidatus Aminicenantales bacterium]